MSGKDWVMTAILTLFGGTLVSVNVANSLRIPAHVVDINAGNAVTGNNILSLLMFTGFIGGLCFGKILEKCKMWMLPCFLCIDTIGLVIIATSHTIGIIAIGAALCGFSTSNCISFVFNSVSDHISSASLTTANAVLLVGCNVGASAAPYILRAVGLISTKVSAGFIAYAIIFGTIAIIVSILNLRKRGI